MTGWAPTSERNPQRVLVCGGRSYGQFPGEFERMRAELCAVRLELATHGFDMLVVHGAARGADTLAANWAARVGLPVERYPADWRLGKIGGSVRNTRMLQTGIDLVVAAPGGAGTADMVRQARAAGVTVWEFE